MKHLCTLFVFLSRSRLSLPEDPPPLAEPRSYSRGRPPMRGPGGAPHGRRQPMRGALGGDGFGAGAAAGGEERRRCRGEGPPGRAQGRLWGGWGRCAGGGGGACLGSSVGPVRGRARRGGEEGEARSAVLYWGSLTVPRAKAAGTRGRGVTGDGAWHWDVRAPDTVSTPPIGNARALSSGAAHPAPSPWVELGSTQGVMWCGVVWCGVVWCGVVRCGVVWCGALCVEAHAVCSVLRTWDGELYLWHGPDRQHKPDQEKEAHARKGNPRHRRHITDALGQQRCQDGADSNASRTL